ncbi:Wadjet anti-phage system protein JetD domain-containing protein [Xenorhabdus griffiniae]|uniref:DUF2220 family protein n=1 Tax=Xenorhabdus griffiniae TaxID=351672 RepID=A0ABY9XGJ9_9GAMM|nr:Wadjet anti-phage system protein JetD domain-containing protein [Xenorhabdus griffiniae]MBD1229053.1 hypothetical protein [Xenorhabdus griffiniae]MBE8588801.1 hypothetical protein [Xenorhabdus griffiniae]WMV72045.1 DUF2220 family protein [Xenorhabdus griffiniae]WNH01723.1 DUF2220 family protein [Xenorhabdus griffiniae]
MNSPDEIAKKLSNQWYNSKLRAERLLPPGNWPLSLPIGKPTSREFTKNTQQVLEHVQAWRNVKIGRVEWELVSYRASNMPISMPLRWVLQKPSEWINATKDPVVSCEFRLLEEIIEHVNTVFHPLLIKNRSLWIYRNPQEVITAAKLANRLTPGYANGLPLRLLSGLGVDTKFIENNTSLLTRLLDERFMGEASKQGLTDFLDALDENNHWVLVIPLSPELLPFKKSKVTTAELAEIKLPAARLLIIENEQCQHQLPTLPDTIAILGTGLDLQWLSNPALKEKSVAYWGDMDTWGLLMLARARKYHPTLSALLMHRELFDEHASHRAVPEPVKAQDTIPDGLLNEEANFYYYLANLQCGRLEQEFLPIDVVTSALMSWGTD